MMPIRPQVVGHHILTKTLCNTGLHILIGMLRYCIKDKGEEHFKCVHKNITIEQIKERVEEYIKYGTPFAKNKIVLTHTNLVDRAITYYRYKLKKQLGNVLANVAFRTVYSLCFLIFPCPSRWDGVQHGRGALEVY